MSQGTIFTKTQYGGQASAFETETTGYTELPRVQSIDIKARNNFIYDRGLGEGTNPVATYLGPVEADGTMDFFLTPSGIDFLKYWVGPKSGTEGTVGDPYTLTEGNTYSLSTSSGIQAFSVEKLNDIESTNSVTAAIGCCGTTLSISGERGSRIKCNANFIARNTLYRPTGESYTPVTESSFVMINGTWKWGATPSALSGVREFSINYENKPSDNNRDGNSRFISQPHLSERNIKGRVGIVMASSLATTIISNFYGKEASGTYSPADGSVAIIPTENLEFKIELVNGSQYANIWLDHCSIDDLSEPMSLGGGIVILYFDFTARQSKANEFIKWWSV